MPRVLINVSEAWLKRYETGVVDVLDALEGTAAQLSAPTAETLHDAYAKMAEIATQLSDLKRQVESWRLMF